jgi:sortase A
VVVRAAAVLMGIGLLLIAFVAYQLWGTAFYEARAQSHLKSELAHQLHHALPTSASSLASHHSGLHFAQKTAPPIPDPALNDPVGLLSIPRIGLLDAIVEGVGEAQLEQGPGHYPGTALPGEPGNVAIAGHRTTYAHPFYNLDALTPGDPIYILTSQGLFHYTVSENQIVSPSDVAVLQTLPGQNTLTLTTCNPRYSAAQRLVITAAFDGRTAKTAAGIATKRPHVTTIAGESGEPSRSSTSSASLGGGSASWVPPVLWGLAAVALAVVGVAVWRWVGRRWRFVVVLVAVPVVVLALLVCFEQVSLALPGSY